MGENMVMESSRAGVAMAGPRVALVWPHRSLVAVSCARTANQTTSQTQLFLISYRFESKKPTKNVEKLPRIGHIFLDFFV